VITPSQRSLPDNTQHSQQTDKHALGGIRTHNLSRRAAADLRLRPRGLWDTAHPELLDINFHYSVLKPCFTVSYKTCFCYKKRFHNFDPFYLIKTL